MSNDKCLMKVPNHNSSLYLIMQQMDMIKKDRNGAEYVVCKTSRDANGDGKIDPDREVIEGKYYGDQPDISGRSYFIKEYYFRNLEYFDKAKVARVAKAMKAEAMLGLDSNEPYNAISLNALSSLGYLGEIGYMYPDLVEDFVPTLGALLYSSQDWVLEKTMNALGNIGSTDPFLVEDLIPRLEEIRDGEGLDLHDKQNMTASEQTDRLMWIACTDLNEINQCSDGVFGNLEGCNIRGDLTGCGLDVFEGSYDNCFIGAQFGWYHTWEVDGTRSAQRCIDELHAETGEDFTMKCQTYPDCIDLGSEVDCHANKTICTII